jgi:transcription-repair coupling factor (superfamily II helicase)
VRSTRVSESAKPFYTAGILRDVRNTVLVLVADPHQARTMFEQLVIWTGEAERALLFPAYRGLFYEHVPPDPVTNQRRLAAMEALSARSGRVVVADLRSVMHRVPLPDQIIGKKQRLQRGQAVSLQDLLRQFVALGYEPASMVVEPGYFAHRGGIVDFFPPTTERPIRLEFFGDEIDGIREYDPISQRSTVDLREAAVVPARELTATLVAELADVLAGVDLSHLGATASERWRGDLATLATGGNSATLEAYAPYAGQASLLDYLPDNGLIVLDEPDRLARTARALAEGADSLHAELLARGEVPGGLPIPYFDWPAISERLAARAQYVLKSEGEFEYDGADSFAAAPAYGGRLKAALDDVAALARAGWRVILTSNQAERLRELLQERGIYVSVRDTVADGPAEGDLLLVKGTLHEGWRSENLRTLLITDAELFGNAKPRPVTTGRRSASGPMPLSDLAAGDYVVHVDHGVGRYQGTIKMAMDGVDRDYLALEYSDGDKMFVPVDQADRVTRYQGAGEGEPTLHRLGTSEWLRAKERVRSSARDIAKELLEVYSSRQVAEGHSFSPDTAWQGEMEAAFPYAETPDQLQAVDDVKADMESSRPMDRLVCGDVGYGKTEVALRAAFKAVMDGKQVAILVPTTVLAQQHHQTFRERLQAFPVKVEVLSRFRSPREQKMVLAGLATGSVDICVGTHRILQNDVQFRNLGLLIVDEEHRFGVAHKERIKRLRKEVDALTLSATPIPRTLHMSLVGVRDMTTIATPPEERHPIRTYLGERKEQVVREAILREIDRGGQVFYVHNRVHRIEEVAKNLSHLVPEAKMAIAHGQMREEQLERVMLEFANGTHDILVCTTIIESGLDMPNVNTIIIDQAERFGLAQLHQLRGRVGRSTERAYAYLLFSPNRRLTPIAEKRLRTVFEATDLGAGLQIALRDLEIRGAGNLLGAEQHGHIAAVGFDLYCRLIAEAVHEIQGKAPEARRLPQVTVDLPIDAYLPPDYVVDEASRLNLYQRLATVTDADGVGQIALEIRDRFGSPPEPVVNLIYLVQLKVAAARAGAQALFVEGDHFVVRLHEGLSWDRVSVMRRFGRSVRFTPNQIRLSRKGLDVPWQAALGEIMDLLAGSPSLAR